MKHLLFFSLLLLTTPIFSQIEVEDVGDGWKNKIELALELIKRTDSNYHNHVIDNCEHIGFWAGKYSTNEGTSIYMTKYDFEMNGFPFFKEKNAIESIWEDKKAQEYWLEKFYGH